MEFYDLDRRLTEELGFGKVFESIGRHRQYYLGRQLERFDLKKGEYRILIQVYIEEGCCLDDIVNILGVDKFDVSKGVKSLIEKGYIIKHRDEHDKRKVRIYATDKAIGIKNEFIKVLEESAEVLVEGISEKDKLFALNILIKIAQNIYKKSQELKKEK